MSERKSSGTEVINQELWQKASAVARGINKLIWAHTCFYIYNHIDEDLKDYGVYLNDYNKFSVKLDDGSEFCLIQPCPWLIYQLYEAKSKHSTSITCDENLMVKAYNKFERFFNHMINYCNFNLTAL